MTIRYGIVFGLVLLYLLAIGLYWLDAWGDGGHAEADAIAYDATWQHDRPASYARAKVPVGVVDSSSLEQSETGHGTKVAAPLAADASHD